MTSIEEHSIHLPHFFTKLNRELREFYAFLGIRSFAGTLVGIFVPIYAYIYFERSLPLTFLFLGVGYLTFGLLSPLGARLPSRIGIKHTILISTPLIFLYYVGLWQIELFNYYSVFIIVIIRGISSAIFWPAYHMFFTRFSDKGHRGKQISYKNIVASMSAIIGPVTGGIIITHLGFPVLFVIVLTLLFASVVPLFLSKEVEEDYHDSYKKTFKNLFKKKNRKPFVAFFSQGLDGIVEAYVWPLFLFIIAINFEQLGAITSASFVATMIFTYFIGKKSDKFGYEKLLSLGVLADALFWPLKAFVRGPFDAFSIHTLHRLSRSAVAIPFTSLFYEWAGENKKSRDSVVVFRETLINLSRGLFLLFLSVIFIFVTRIEVMFFAASFFVWGYLFIIRDPAGVKNELLKNLKLRHKELDS